MQPNGKEKVDRTLVRNQPYTQNQIKAIERHNERKNTNYTNCDVLLEHSPKNVYFKKCDKTYNQVFDNLLKNGQISTKGLKTDGTAHLMAEMMFDVNTDYFERNGGYLYARDFYAQAYELAKEIAGDEKYILSAVMHADERNKPLSEEQGKDVFH